jgi:hypothetical protein
MGVDHNDIYSIVERLRMLEEGLTPAMPKIKGLNSQQKSVNQLSATFKPKTVAVLTAKTDPKNPMAGKLVGGCEESQEPEEQPLEEAITSEDVLDKVKSSFADYLKNVADEIATDSDLKDKKKGDSDLKSKDKKDQDLVSKKPELDEAEPVTLEVAPAPAPIKTITNECGLWEVHGNERDGFEIRRGHRVLPSRFKNLDEAEMALEMFAHRMRKQDESQDYIDEA